eukprot:gnl/MRDRNA2_/MRDRNA2_114003_c0_seq1.p1 gnl/MRDRNA2_/MRDRNA2_114003_c0~~gnl/MRDRNA2_/MRDRNA2_114003_c0_seq1.p1  ORF type:complete len:1618 (-),score=323.50 gnl/MRDRNA2_/MRDRNA2_114003_c0_seq1:20-4873(-)
MAHFARSVLFGVLLCVSCNRVSGKREVGEAYVSEALYDKPSSLGKREFSSFIHLNAVDSEAKAAHTMIDVASDDMEEIGRIKLNDMTMINPVYKAPDVEAVPQCGKGHCGSMMETKSRKSKRSKISKKRAARVGPGHGRGSDKMWRKRTKAMRKRMRIAKAQRLAQARGKVDAAAFIHLEMKSGQKSRHSSVRRHGGDASNLEPAPKTDSEPEATKGGDEAQNNVQDKSLEADNGEKTPKEKTGSEEEDEENNGGEGEGEGEGDEEEEEDEKFELDQEARMWLAHGWMIVFLLVNLTVALVLLLRAEALRAFLWLTGHDLKRTVAPAGEEPTLFMEIMCAFFFGEGWANFFFEILVLVVGIANFAVFAQNTEIAYVKAHQAEEEEDEGVDVVANFLNNATFWENATYYVELPSLIFVGTVIVLRLMAVGAHPKWKVYGHSAWWRYLLQDIFVQCDMIACIPTVIDYCSGKDLAINFLWFTMVRGFAFVGKSKLGKTGNIFGDILKENGKLLLVSSMFGVSLWITLGGLYYLSNKDSADPYEEAIVKATGEEWQRFESIPSSMFYCLINLLKEHPLADVHHGFFARTWVVFSVIIGVPIMAVPTGILGAAIESKTKEYLADTREPPEEEEAEAEPGPLLAFLRSPAWQIITFILAYGSLAIYFFSTSKMIVSVTPGEDDDDPADFTYKNGFTWFGAHMEIGPGVVAWTDGLVGAIFLVEFVLRLLTGTVTCGHALVDILSSAPGIVHFLLYVMGVGMHQVGFEWMQAIMCLRVLKMDRFLDSFKDIKEIFYDNRYVFGVTVFIGGMLLMFFTTVLYFTERRGFDGDIDEIFGSVKRGLWGEMINLHGEYPWCDFTAEGKATMVFIGLVGIGLFCVPLGIFGNGFADKLRSQASDFEVETKSWQELDQPAEDAGPQRRVHDFLYTGNTLGFGVYFYFMLAMVFISVATTATCDMDRFSDSLKKNKNDKGEIEPDDAGIKWLNCDVKGNKQKVTAALADFEKLPEAEQEDKEPEFKCLPFCKDDEQCVTEKTTLWYIDLILIVAFAVDMGLRFFVHTYKYLLSWVGWIDIISLVAFCVTTFSGTGRGTIREAAFHPDFHDGDISDDLAAMWLIARLLRILCLESLKPAIHVMYNVTRINWRPLVKAFYSMLCMWFICATLLYMFERESELDDDGLRMNHRYRDIPTALQYAIVHLKGDYPLVNYTASTRLLLTCVIIFGIAFIGAPTGIFAAGFGSYFESERKKELREISRKRIETLTWAVARLQIQWKRTHRKEGIAHEADGPSEGAEGSGSLACSEYFRDFMNQKTCWGNFFVSLSQSLLVLNVCATIWHSIPEQRENKAHDKLFDAFEIFCTFIFSLEYIFRFLSAGAIAFFGYSRLRWFIYGRNLLDLICICPMYLRVFMVPTLCDGQWSCHGNAEWEWLAELLESIVIIRALRLLQFTCIKYEVNTILKVLRKAGKNLWAPGIVALAVWAISSTMFMWLQCYYSGDNMIPGQDEEEDMTDIPSAMYWCSIFLLGEWANVDFTDGAGSRMCIIYCLVGVMLFTIPMGIIMDAVTSTLAEEQAEIDAIKNIDKALRDKGETAVEAFDRLNPEEAEEVEVKSPAADGDGIEEALTERA